MKFQILSLFSFVVSGFRIPTDVNYDLTGMNKNLFFTKIFIFHENVDFKKFSMFSMNISVFDKKFNFLTKVSIFDENVSF